MSAEVYHLVPRTMRTIRQQAADLDAVINIPFKAAARLGVTLTPEDHADEGLIRAIEILNDPENLERAITVCTEPSRKAALEDVRKGLVDGRPARGERAPDRFEVQGLAVFVRTALAEIDAEFVRRIGPRLPVAAVLNGTLPARDVLCRQVAVLADALARERNPLASELDLSRPARYSSQQLQRLKTVCRRELDLPDAAEVCRTLARRLAEKAGPDLVALMLDLAERHGVAEAESFEPEAVRRLVARFPRDRACVSGPVLEAAQDALAAMVRENLEACDAAPEEVRTLTAFAEIALSRRAFRAAAALVENREAILSRPGLSLGAEETGRRLYRLRRLLLTWPLAADEAWDEARSLAAAVSPECRDALDATLTAFGRDLMA